ncbi:S24 family peptidase [Citrobacter freundii]|nr:S24 family peptidase [Citrobacter freundii]
MRDEFIETIKSIEYSTEGRELSSVVALNHIKMIAVNGDSMSGTFEPRDQIFVDVSIDCFDGDGIYIFVLDNDLYIKRLQSNAKAGPSSLITKSMRHGASKTGTTLRFESAKVLVNQSGRVSVSAD